MGVAFCFLFVACCEIESTWKRDDERDGAKRARIGEQEQRAGEGQKTWREIRGGTAEEEGTRTGDVGGRTRGNNAR